MSNPWSQAYEELRKPYLEGKMAKKDYDGDGKIESGTDEYKGSVDKAIKKSMAEKGKKKVSEHHTKDADGKVIEHGDGTPSSVEEEQINELSKKTLGSYVKKSALDIANRGVKLDKNRTDDDDEKSKKRLKGITKASNKLAKEDTEQLDELKLSDKEKEGLNKSVRNATNNASRKIGLNVAKARRFDKYKMKKEDTEQLDELSKKTLGGYIKKASKETRGNMVATQHGSGIPKKAKDIKLKQVNKRLKGMEKAGEKLAKEEVKMSRKEYSKIHKDFKSDDPKNPRTTKYVKGKGTVSMPVKFTDEYHYLEKHLELQLDEAGTLGTLHVADMKGNTPAWQNRMGVNKKGKRLYDFGQDLIQKLSYEYPDDMEMIEAKDTSAMKKYLDAKAKKLSKEKEAQKPEYKNNPAFGDPSHHSNRKNRKEAFSDWRSDFIWEDGDSIKKT